MSSSLAKDPRSPSVPLPKYHEFHDPLMKALARATGFRSGNYVACAPVILDTLREAGYDPDNLPHGWPLKGKKGVARRVREQFRYAHRDWSEPLTSLDQPGMWGLTDSGIARARAVMGCTDRNATAAYLDRRLKETGGMDGALMTLLRAALTKKLPRSATAGIVDDHIHNCLIRLISRDSLRERLLQSKRIPDTLLASFVVRSGYTDIRRMGVEPICREMYGARTEREREKGTETGPLSDPRIIWNKTSEDGDVFVEDIVDIHSLDAAQEVVDRADFEALWAEVETAFRVRKPKAWPRYLGVVKMRADGWTVKEIADAEEVSPYRAASIMTEARRCLREACEVGELVFG